MIVPQILICLYHNMFGGGGGGKWPTCLTQESIIWAFLRFSEYLHAFPGPKEVM